MPEIDEDQYNLKISTNLRRTNAARGTKPTELIISTTPENQPENPLKTSLETSMNSSRIYYSLNMSLKRITKLKEKA